VSPVRWKGMMPMGKLTPSKHPVSRLIAGVVSAGIRCAAGSLVVALLGMSLLAIPALATDYPNRPVRIVIPFSAGGAPDIVMRVLGQALSEKWRQSIVIENRPGANTYLGTTAVARSEPDGYTLLFTADGTFILNALLYTGMPYSMKDFDPITLVATTPHILAVSNKVPAKTTQEFVALAKTKKDEMTFGSSGPGSIQRLAFEFFSRITGISLIHVPYRGANEAATALVAGEIDSTITGLATVYPQVLAGTVRGFAISTKQRSQLAPDLPTIHEAGAPGYSSQGAFGLMAPAGVPQDIRDKIQRDIAEILNTSQIKKVLADRYFEPAATGQKEFLALIDEETIKWRQVIKEKDIKGD